jgi:ATP-dependent Clp protease adaptor protein ClpS
MFRIPSPFGANAGDRTRIMANPQKRSNRPEIGLEWRVAGPGERRRRRKVAILISSVAHTVWRPLDKPGRLSYFGAMAASAIPEVRPGIVETPEDEPRSGLEPGYLVICWNDPVNYMEYVTHVFQKVFGWPRKKAEFHMLQVHEQGKSVLTREGLEKAEHYVHQLQRYSLHATMERVE